MKIRFATLDDSSAILGIYAQYIDTPITFECVLPTLEEFTGRMEEIMNTYPYLVCEQYGKVVGYAYAHRHMERAAYQWNAELSVYMDKKFTAKGLGHVMYIKLMDILRLQGIRTVYGCITLPNEKSEKMHKTLGFRQLAIYRNAGYKCRKWHDVAWYEKPIASYDLNPEEIRPVSDIPREMLGIARDEKEV